jgi:hypothetical protein
MSAAHLLRRACVVLVTATAAVAAAAGGAQAAGGGELLIDLADDDRGFVRVTDEPWLEVDDLAPGSVRTRDVVLWNTTDQPMDLHLQVTRLEDDENGCVDPERQVAGEECGVDGGELSSWLTVELVPRAEAGTGPAAGSTTAASLVELAEAPQQVPATIRAGEELALVLRLRFLPESVNDTMTDQVGFDLRLTASHGGRPPAVLGVEGFRHAGPMSVLGPTISTGGGDDVPGLLGRAVALPVIGATLPLGVLFLGLAAVLVGAAMMVRGRRVGHHLSTVPWGL